MEIENTKIERLTVTVPQMAEMIGISRPKAYELANRADFPAIRLGRKIVVPKDKLRDWLDRQVEMGVKSI